MADLCSAINAKYIGMHALEDVEVCKPLTDSRDLYSAADSVFFALRTQTGNGHDFIPALYANGVRAFVVDSGFPGIFYPDAAFLVVEDVAVALREVASLIRRNFNGVMVAVTGSRGKTVVKEMLYGALTPHMSVARSPRSFNSQTGVPLSMWEIQQDTQVAVIEAGISKHGEMQTLADVIRPDIGVFTSLTDEHQSGFASLQQKARDKAVLFKTCRTIIYDADNDVIGGVLTEMYPDKHLVAAHGYADMVRATAMAIAPTVTDIDIPQPVNSRIDISDTDLSAAVAFDHFTCDVSGIITGLQSLRRRVAADNNMVAVVGNHIDSEAMLPFGVTEVIREADMEEAVIAPDANVYINVCDKLVGKALYNRLAKQRNVTRLEINLDAVAANFRAYRNLLPPQTHLIGMIKAFGYGCGDIEVGRTLQDIGAAMVAVAVVDEGVALRRAGITVPVLVLDPWCENMRAIFANALEPTLIDASEEMLCMLERYADEEGVTDIRVHLKLDTGMHRVGLHKNDISPFAQRLKRHPRIHIASVFSHLATADCLDKDDYTIGQLILFDEMTAALSEALGYAVPRHILNTAGITRFAKQNVYDFARLGIGLYGILPDSSLKDVSPALTPVARLVTRIIAVSEYPAGATVGYGGRGVLGRPSRIATLPIGYADGIDRHLGRGNASFQVNGVMCPTVGNICMDLCMIDITDVPDAGAGSEVEIFGPDAPIERLADTLDTIPYEVLARISPRVKRMYFRE